MRMTEKISIVKTSIVFDTLIMEYLQRRAEQEDRSLSAVVRRMIYAEMERAPKWSGPPLHEAKGPHKV